VRHVWDSVGGVCGRRCAALHERVEGVRSIVHACEGLEFWVDRQQICSYYLWQFGNWNLPRVRVSALFEFFPIEKAPNTFFQFLVP
jgi:hypothetical protein